MTNQAVPQPSLARLTPYIRLLRPDNWFKNIFMAPGILLAFYFSPELLTWSTAGAIVWGLAAACLIASGNYVFNEILDAASDRHHPVKHNRPLASGAAKVSAAWVLWICVSMAGLASGFALNFRFGITGALLWIAGILYNVPPIRLKDIPYGDVLSESLNNPLRLALGWYATGLGSAPPFSMFMAYWMFGAFLMAAKRFAEFRMIGNAERAARYRRSFLRYTEESLIESIFFYATLFALMSGYFIARYRFELVLATPLVALAMAYYLHLAYKPGSPVQYPELLYRQKKLVLIVLAAFLACTALLFVDLPGFDRLFAPWILPPLPAAR
ncbi:MAG: UbiA prenyltransferase family protein [Lentisphaerae bacterium]|nr:UbiA prenyltransferase family protein [Lentisphaerota bacterium]